MSSNYLSLDGHTGYVEIANSPDLSVSGSVTGITIHAEIKPGVLDFPVTDGTTDQYVNFIGKNNPTGNNREWVLRIYNKTSTRPNRISGYVFTPSVSLGVGSYFQDTLTTDQQIKITLVVDNSNTYIYRDGILRDCDCYSGTCSSSSCPLSSEAPVYPSHASEPVRIGTDYLHSFFLGNIYEVRVYNKPLSSSEVLSLSNGTFTDTSNLVLWHNYKLGNAADQSGHGHDGILHGGAQFVSGCIQPIASININI